MNNKSIKYFGHTIKGIKDESQWEPLKDHLKLVSDFTSKFSSKFGYKNIGNFLGINHDIGKASLEFLRRLRGEIEHADHSSAALIESAKYFDRIFESPDVNIILVLKSILNILIGHHGGLKNFSEVNDRFSKKDFLSYDEKYFKEIPEIREEVIKLSSLNPNFDLSVMIRMLYSCLVDADGIATERFMDIDKSVARNNRLTEFKTWGEYEKIFMDHYCAKFSKSENNIINQCRREVFESSIKSSSLSPGFFSLTAPVGMAKTLACIIFGILHAKLYSKDRILYLMPFNTIIDQNAFILKEFIGHRHILEHHSDFDYRELRDDGTKGSFDMASKLLTTNWDSPFVISSLVQFLDSFFSNRVSKCRKLHNYNNSVIILDEFQSIPPDRVKQILMALDILKREYNCTILLSTATLPSVKRSPWLEFGLKDVREIISNPRDLYIRARRVKTVIIKKKLSYDQLFKKMLRSYNQHGQVLCIVNYKEHADYMAEYIRGKGFLVFYLSTDLGPVSRQVILSKIRKNLDNGIPFFCVTTPIIEAGIDIDFPVVYRQATGLDSEEQARGRCNRHGKRTIGYFYRFIFKEKDPSNIFDTQTAIANAILFNAPKNSNPMELMEKYMDQYYRVKRMSKHQMDKGDIVSEACRSLDFTEIAKFKVIDQSTIPVVCPHTAYAKKIVEEFMVTDNPWKYFGRLQKYTLNLYPNKFDALKKKVNVLECNNVLIIDPKEVDKVYNDFRGIDV